MCGEVICNITEYMNSWSGKVFTQYQVSAIRTSIKIEYTDRIKKGLSIKSKTADGKELLDERIAEIANKRLGGNVITADDVRLYKKCLVAEYTDRTGKCAWGFKDVRKKYGYDPETGYAIE